jgi:hypothetical protein
MKMISVDELEDHLHFYCQKACVLWDTRQRAPLRLDDADCGRAISSVPFKLLTYAVVRRCLKLAQITQRPTVHTQYVKLHQRKVTVRYDNLRSHHVS